jgi:hypothetical protein
MLPKSDQFCDRWINRVAGALEDLRGRAVMLRGENYKDDGFRAALPMLIHHFEELAISLELEPTKRQIEFLRLDTHGRNLASITDDKLAGHLENIARCLRRDCQDRFLHRVSAGKADWYRADFGESVAKAFPSAQFDITEASTCYALERPTASIFHAMRAAEIGLRALARERKVKFKKWLLEWQDWNTIISEIHAEFKKEVGAWARGPHKDAFVDFYSGALGEVEAFKDAYRNHVMHSRPHRPYTDHDAQVVLAAVKRFLRRLSERTNEKGRRIQWKK